MATPDVPSRVGRRQVTATCKYCEFPHAPTADEIGKGFIGLEVGSIAHLGGVPHRLCEWPSLFDNDPRVEPGREFIDQCGESLSAPNTFWDCLNPEAMPCRVALRVKSSDDKYIATFIGIGETWINKPCDLIVIRRNGEVIDQHTVPLNFGDLININCQEQGLNSSIGTKWGKLMPGSKIIHVGIYFKRDSPMYVIGTIDSSAVFMHEGTL